jgi:hypothetical protein
MGKLAGTGSAHRGLKTVAIVGSDRPCKFTPKNKFTPKKLFRLAGNKHFTPELLFFG